jgi:hypothetical protein
LVAGSASVPGELLRIGYQPSSPRTPGSLFEAWGAKIGVKTVKV